ncbi:hypothetical protein [Pseudomonas sp.]|uniref:hypothetical protein n=1 Tax=Pseudomonas sp. TaxID=306 RepID=UPI002489663F|nr:hypothetical protein [Pseudomonas sp.]MDI1333156.1 hypothetical protein [Pseudomonas sp.]
MSSTELDEVVPGAVEITPQQLVEEIADPLGHLSAEQVENIYKRYLGGEKTSDLINEFGINTNTNSLMKLLPPLERTDLTCPYCSAHGTQRRAARNKPANRPTCTRCDHIFPMFREDVCGCRGCKSEYLSQINGEGMRHRIAYDQLTLREKILLLAALTMAGPADVTCFSFAQLQRWHRRLAPTPEYQNQCISELFSRHIILVSADTSSDALDFYRRYDRHDFLWWTPNVSAADSNDVGLDVQSLQMLIVYDLERNKAELESVLTELIYELAEEDLVEYLRYRVENAAVVFKAERATREVLRPLLASSSISNIFSFIWKAVKQADNSLEKGTVKGATHAGNRIPSVIVRAAEAEKQNAYERSKQSRICQVSEVIYNLILDDPDGSFKVPLPRYTAEVMRPVLEGISSAKDAKFA